MTPKDVLSVLGQMELELTHVEAQRRSLRYIREIMTTLQEAEGKLEAVTIQAQTMASDMALLKDTHDEAWRVHRKALAEDKQKALGQQEALEQKVAALRAETILVEAQADEKARFANARIAALDQQIADKQAALERVSQDFDKFMKSHGMTG